MNQHSSGVGILISPQMRIVCIIDTVAIKLRFVCKHNVTMQMATAIEPLAKVQPLSKIFRSEMLHLLHVVWIHALCMQCSPHSRVGNTKRQCHIQIYYKATPRCFKHSINILKTFSASTPTKIILGLAAELTSHCKYITNTLLSP
jgi:hypothetical protein